MPGLKDEKPVPMITLAAVTLMLTDERFQAALDRREMQKKFAQDLDRLTREARASALSEARTRAFQAHDEGRYEATPLVNDPYRDLIVTLAEVRTNTFALKLIFDDQDGYRIQGSVRRHAHARPRRIAAEFGSFEDATAAYTRIAARFGGRISSFRTQVDY